MQRFTRTLIAGATLATLSLAPVVATAQESNGNSGRQGGVNVDASGQNTVYQNDAGASGQRTVINHNPGVQSVNSADGQGNSTEQRAARRDQRRADRAAAQAAPAAYDSAAPLSEAAPVPEAAPVAPEAAPAPVAAAAAPAASAAPASGVPLIVALPNTGVGPAHDATLAAALAALALASAGTAVAWHRPRTR